jgi:hypothetical protein
MADKRNAEASVLFAAVVRRPNNPDHLVAYLSTDAMEEKLEVFEG